MADLIYEFGADVTQFNASIAEVTKEIKKLKDVLKTATGAEIPKLNAEISALQTSLGNLKSVGTPAATAFGKVEDSAKGARIALTNVSQIAQDLPFGFIGIQNNIPGLVQSFGKLAGESGGAVAALKAMGSALIGPAGIFLAFSVVTAAVTGLITKYGSLGVALDALFGKTNLLAKAQKEYNKELSSAIGNTATESLEIGILSKTLLDLDKPLKDRQAAYVELKKISPDVLAGISAESIATGKYTTLLLGNVTAIQSLIYLKAKEAALTALINKNVAEQTALENERPALIAKLTAAQNAYTIARQKGFDGTKNFGAIIDQEALALESAQQAYGANVKAFNNLIPAYKEFEKTLIPTINGIAEIDLRTKELTDSLKEQEKVINAPKGKVAKEKKGLDALEIERRGRIAAQKLQEQADKNRLRFLNEQLKAEQKLTKEFEKKQEQQTNADAKAFSKVNFKNLSDTLNPILAELNNLAQGAKNVAILIEESFFAPLNDMFTTLFTKGTFAIKDFTNALLTSIGQIAAKLAATAIVNGLISLFAVPFGGAFATGGLLGGLGSLLGGIGASAGSANFGGVQGGNLGMSGSVNMVLRGTDLVGSINRTNSQISRVG
jgi:hypothetical protein